MTTVHDPTTAPLRPEVAHPTMTTLTRESVRAALLELLTTGSDHHAAHATRPLRRRARRRAGLPHPPRGLT